jgi:hypothetical protein
MFKKKTHEEETPTPVEDKYLTADQFRIEAEEHAERAERARLEHRAQELGVTVARLKLGIMPVVDETPFDDSHVRESIRESDKADKTAHRHR